LFRKISSAIVLLWKLLPLAFSSVPPVLGDVQGIRVCMCMCVCIYICRIYIYTHAHKYMHTYVEGGVYIHTGHTLVTSVDSVHNGNTQRDRGGKLGRGSTGQRNGCGGGGREREG
jgi:hypothetical protein